MRHELAAGCAAFLLAVSVSTVADAQSDRSTQTIEWQVNDRFRLWDRARSGGAMSLEALLEAARSADRPDQLYASLRRFLADQPTLHSQAYWRDGEEIYDRSYVWAASYSVSARARQLGPQSCLWSAPAIGMIPQSARCDAPITLEIPSDGTGTGSQSIQLEVVAEDGRRAQADIRVRDRLIASIGDSFASGEGNPDRPTDLTRIADTFHNWEPDWIDRWPGRRAVIGPAGAAQWWDSRCHRSFMSQHMVAALRYAAAHPQEATTFVTYACSGAATFNGLLAVQARPPGYRDSRLAEELDYPQVEVLVANMCRSRSTNGPYQQYPVRGRWISAPTFGCRPGDPRRPIDILLVSIGGNDVGFASVIQDALMPDREEVGTVGRIPLRAIRRLGTITPEEAQRRIEQELPVNYDWLRQRLSQVLSPTTAVFQTVYPYPLQSETGEMCGRPEGYDAKDLHPHSAALTAFTGFWPDRGVKEERRWRFIFDEAEGREIDRRMVHPLNAAVRENATTAGWTLVDGFASAFDGRGWCAADEEAGPEGLPTGPQGLALPNWDPISRSWGPWAPSSWRPYASRQRLFRTPNDAVLTQQPANARRTFGAFSVLFGSALERQQDALLASTAGSFHPTFEAHTIIGWSLGEAINQTSLRDPEPISG